MDVDSDGYVSYAERLGDRSRFFVISSEDLNVSPLITLSDSEDASKGILLPSKSRVESSVLWGATACTVLGTC